MKRKINTLGKVCHILSLIATILVIVGGAFCLIAGCALCAVPDSALTAEVAGDAEIKVYGDWIDAIPQDVIDSTRESIEFGSSSVSVDGKQIISVEQTPDALVMLAKGTAGQLTLRRLGVALLADCLPIACFVYLLIMLTKLTKKLQTCESPFAGDVVKAMTHFGISLIPYALLKPLAGSFAGTFLTTGEISVDFRLDLSGVFAVLVVLLLIAIFKYGAQLQKEADETL